MSFIKEVKKELLEKSSVKAESKNRGKSFKSSQARCCQLAELSAFTTLSVSIGKFDLKFDDKELAEKLVFLIESLFKYTCEIVDLKKGRTTWYQVVFTDKETEKKVFSTARIDGYKGVSLRETCCKRIYIRTVFILCGTISNPDSSYNLECIFKNIDLAREFQKLLEAFEIFAKIIARKKYYVLYLKDAEQISKLLNVLGCHRALLDFEQLRVMKEYRNRINRQVNCETANSNKAVKASVSQLEDIEYIRDRVGLDYLDDGLSELARLRLEEPFISMTQLGSMLNTPLSKSGVNHRFKKIKDIANSLRSDS